MTDLALALDLGGTRYRTGVVGRDGQILARRAGLTRQEEGPEQALRRIERDLAAVRGAFGEDRFAGLGISAPGPLDPRTGVLLWPPNMPRWHGLDLGPRLGNAVSLPAWVENDANLGVLAEHRWGAGRGLDHLIYLTLSTGVGSGVISHGRLITGRDGLAVEAGHMTVDWDGPPCPCGSNGCFERLASGTWIGATARERLAAGAPSTLAGQPPAAVDAAAVAEAARSGDPLALEIVSGAARALGVALTNLVNLFNPQLITIGGGVAGAADLLLPPADALVRRRAMRGFAEGLRIEITPLGEHVTLLGAAALVFTRREG